MTNNIGKNQSPYLAIYAVSALTLGVFLYQRIVGCSPNGNNKQNTNESKERVKITERVFSSNDLLIKKIARETAKLISSLPSDRHIVNMSQGVPCLPIFDRALAEMVKLLNTRLLPYSDVPGTSDVRVVCAKFVNEMYKTETYSPGFTEENVTVTSGAIQAIYCSLAISVEGPNDVVLTTLPAYGLYLQQTKILGGTFDSILTSKENNFVPTGKQLKAAFQKHATYEFRNFRLVKACKVRSVVLCFPNNPTGSMLSVEQAKEIVEALNDLLDQYPEPGFSVILDEVYLGITASKFVSLVQYASAALRKNLFIILSASKGLGAMPGARAAWVTAPSASLINQITKIQLVTSGNCSTVSQVGLKGSLEYLMNNPQVMSEVSEYYGERAEFVANKLNKIGEKYKIGQICRPGRPEATFYVWACFRTLQNDLNKKYKNRITSDLELAAFLRSMYTDDQHKAGVAVVPGSAFLMNANDKFIRFSCAKENIAELELAMSVVDKAVKLLLE